MRPDWDETYLEIAKTVAKRATCPRLHVGAVLAKHNAILTTGYNGAPSGQPQCDDWGCLMIEGHCKRTVHAERNAIIWAAKRGPFIEGATLYLTHSPCRDCLLLMIQVGIVRIVFQTWYGSDWQQVEQLALEAGIEMENKNVAG